MEAPYLDPTELPFTEDEVHRAARLWVSEGEAAEFVQGVREELKLGPARASGSDTERTWTWLRPEWLLPALSVISESCEERARRFIGEWWAALRQAYIHDERQRAAVAAGVLADNVPARTPGTWAMYTLKGPLPAPTPTMVGAAEQRVATQMREWEELVDEARRRQRAAG